MFNSMPALPPSSSSEEGRYTVVAVATGTTTSLEEGTTSTTITINPTTEPMFNYMPALPPPSSSEEGRYTVVAVATGTTTTAGSISSARFSMSRTMSHPKMLVRSSQSPSFLSPLTTEAPGSTSSGRNTIYLRTGSEEKELTQQENSSSLSSSFSSMTGAKEYDESSLSCEVAPTPAHPAKSPYSINTIINSCQLPPNYWNADNTKQIPYLSGDYSNSDLTPFTGNAPLLLRRRKRTYLNFC